MKAQIIFSHSKRERKGGGGGRGRETDRKGMEQDKIRNEQSAVVVFSL